MLRHIKEILKFGWYCLAGPLFTISFFSGFIFIITIPIEKRNLFQNISLLGLRGIILMFYWSFCGFLFIYILKVVRIADITSKFFRKIGTRAMWDFKEEG